MCGGPPGNQMRMTDFSEVADSDSFAVKRNGNKPPKPSEPNDSAPIFRKCRRESGPGQSKAGFRIKSSSGNVTSSKQAG
jgi:hypothetical protein